MFENSTIVAIVTVITVGVGGYQGFNYLTKTNEQVVLKPSVTNEWIIAKIRQADSDVTDLSKWGTGLTNAMKHYNLPINKENVCATIAVISQESGFKANPAVPNLGKMSIEALTEKLQGIPLGESVLKDYLVKGGHLKKIQNAKTEKDLDYAYRGIWDGLIKDFGLKYIVDTGLLNGIIERNNDINTVGCGQVGVSYALSQNKVDTLQDIYKVRDSMYTINGCTLYTVGRLLDFQTNYNKKVYRFADYNGSKYTSRNAAFQLVVSELSKIKLDYDGDLMMWTKRENPRVVFQSNTEKAIQSISDAYNLGYNRFTIKAALIKEKELAFEETALYKNLMDLYQKQTGKKPQYAMLPVIQLTSVKLGNKFTTAKFANMVNGRYSTCIK